MYSNRTSRAKPADTDSVSQAVRERSLSALRSPYRSISLPAEPATGPPLLLSCTPQRPAVYGRRISAATRQINGCGRDCDRRRFRSHRRRSGRPRMIRTRHRTSTPPAANSAVGPPYPACRTYRLRCGHAVLPRRRRYGGCDGHGRTSAVAIPYPTRVPHTIRRAAERTEI